MRKLEFSVIKHMVQIIFNCGCKNVFLVEKAFPLRDNTLSGIAEVICLEITRSNHIFPVYRIENKQISGSPTPLTLIYDSVTLPIMCKCMYRKSSRKIARVNRALNDLQINLTCSTCQNGQGNILFKADYLLKLDLLKRIK